MQTKFIFITGGVVSGLGKGIAAASIGALLESRGLTISLMKLDPYINVDAGTMNPFQHGEVFVTVDGAETDLDLGHYERYTNAVLTRRHNRTTGQIYDGNKIVGIDAVVLSTQHDENVSQEQLHRDIKEHIIKPVLPANWLTEETKYHINPTGRFVIGGPVGDAGLTGRKIIVDTYGGMARHGGGAFSGKDPSKVDRSAAYAARYVAKNIVSAGLADRCEVQVSYAIGVAEPTSIHVETFGTSKLTNPQLDYLVRTHFDLRPRAISTMLDLNRPIYLATAAYGHFGRDDLNLSWESTDRANALAQAAAKL